MDSLALAIFAFVMAIINDSLGGGYGTLSAPLLLIFGYSAKVTVPAILVSEGISEFFSSAWNVKFENVNYRTFGLTTLGGILGIVVAVFAIGVFLTSTAAKLYISAIAIVMGIFVIVRSHSFFTRYSYEKTKTNTPLSIILGAVCGFNKSSTGGGYGPLSTSGFLLLGLTPSKAVGTTILTQRDSLPHLYHSMVRYCRNRLVSSDADGRLCFHRSTRRCLAEQLRKVESHPSLPQQIPGRGYDLARPLLLHKDTRDTVMKLI